MLRVKANVDTLQPWHDTELKAGDRWDKEIRIELEQMHIFLCLVSFQFLASEYIQKVELLRAEARHKNGEIEVVPVLLYPMDLKHDCEFLYQLNPLPEWGKSWWEFTKDGDWNAALYPIGKGAACRGARAAVPTVDQRLPDGWQQFLLGDFGFL